MVDNASYDGTEAQIRSSFPEVKFIANNYNAGFSAANNQGFEIAKGQNILLLNPDAKLINSDLNKALTYLEKNPKTIIGPELLNPDLSLQDSVIAVPTFTNVLSEAFFLTYFFTTSLESLLKESYALSGACLLMTRVTYAQLQGLDKDLFWMDDVDFSFRAKQQGITTLYFAEWSVVHVIGQSGKKNYKVSISNQLISKLKFFKKHKQSLNYFLSAIFIEFHILLRILLFLPLVPFKAIYRLKFSAYCYAQTLLFKYIFTNQKQTF